MSGPLDGLRVVEMEAIGPVPWAGMMLADMGADVVRVDRAAGKPREDQWDRRFDVTGRGKRSVEANLKTEEGRDAVMGLVERADVLIEGLRPGVMERLGVGPDECLARNERLVYGRMTGWGQTGPLAKVAGHDINYIAVAGALHGMGQADRQPMVPLNLVGDYGGGGMLLMNGVLAALLECRTSGRGQVVDAAMVDGVTALMAPFYGLWQAGAWTDQRESNLLDGAAPFYGTYETSDGGYLAVGAIESGFYVALINGLGLAQDTLGEQHDKSNWPLLRRRFAEIFRSKTRAQWVKLFDGTDACVSPVLSLSELRANDHLESRVNFVEVDGVIHPAPAPRFSRTASAIAASPPVRAEMSMDAFGDWNRPRRGCMGHAEHGMTAVGSEGVSWRSASNR